MFATIAWTMFVAGPPVAKLPPETAKEMTEVIIAVNKALGLESWDAHSGEKPCVNRGGLEATIRDVSAEETRECAATALAQGFPGLGKEYVLGITMADIGPVTVFAIGIGEAEGWGGYSCDPKRRCRPIKLGANQKHARRLAKRYRNACGDAKTVWFPNRDMAGCAGEPVATEPAPPPPNPKAKAPAAKPAPDGTPPRTPWPVKE
ncbi:MAG: hypothetical protein JXP73_10740 [Deltaproteobacteria bacterium]|nr:hypothetical protein [Deltaproteobacteria bacterium]